MKKLLIIALAVLSIFACRPANQTQTLSDRQKTQEQIRNEEELRRRQAKEWKRVNEGTIEASRKSAIPKHRTPNPEPKSERRKS